MTADVRFSFSEVNDRDAWDALLESLPTSSVYTSWAWGEYKRRQGWVVTRVAIQAGNVGSLIGCAQVQIRRMGPVRVILIQGGIHSHVMTEDAVADMLAEFQTAHLRVRSLDVILFNHHPLLRPEVGVGLLRAGYSPTVSSRMYSYAVDVRLPLSTLEQNLSKNWRHNLKRAGRDDHLKVAWATLPAERRRVMLALAEMYSTLTRRKSFAGAINMTNGLDWIIDDARFEIIEAAVDGEVVAARVVYVANDHVMDFLAASSERAKNIYATYRLMWSVFVRAGELQKAFVECGGIDPHGNPGVFNFKKGMGGRLVLLGPLWLYSRSWLLRAVTGSWLARPR